MIYLAMTPRRILAIDLTSRGFGFVVFEAGRPIDWGTTYTRGNRRAVVLRRLADLMRRLRPHRLLIEDYAAAESRRCRRVKQLLGAIERQASDLGVKARRVPDRAVRAHFCAAGAVTKRQRAVLIASRFPELAPRLPPVR